MKKFVLIEMLLLSLLEKRAKRVEFHPKSTIILGENGTGKSCLIKSIYNTFGAEPAKLHNNWKDAAVVSLVKFSIDFEVFSILKNGDSYSIFDKGNRLIRSFESVTNELGPFLANTFDFGITLNDRRGRLITPPPAYLFLPYYIDQDKSWESNWASFERLRQFPKWRMPIAEYHSGIRFNEYYETVGKINQIKDDITKNEKELEVLEKLLKNLRQRLATIQFDIDIDSFRKEITELLAECELLNERQAELRSILSELHTQKISIQNQIKITDKALHEARGDYKYAAEVLEDVVECPTCGAQYENSFAERFAIAKDEQRCYELLLQLKNDLNDAQKKIEFQNEKFKSNAEQLEKIDRILESKHEEIKLRDVIQSEGKKELRNIFENEISEISSLKEKKLNELSTLRDALKKLNAKERIRRKTILDEYRSLMKKYLYDLDVHTLKEKAYSRIYTSIVETGSSLPRALIAYYFSFLHVAKKYTSCVYCPIIIDSPNQQAQDPKNLLRILNFIRDNQPEDSQMILGLEDKHNISFTGTEIILTEKLHLLQQDEYEEVFNNLKPFLEQTFRIGG